MAQLINNVAIAKKQAQTTQQNSKIEAFLGSYLSHVNNVITY